MHNEAPGKTRHWPGGRPELVVVGHVTRDLIGDDVRLGGAVTFASRAASALGIRTGIITAAPADFELLAPLRDDPRIDLACVPAAVPTTFELDYSGPVRRVRLVARAPSLRGRDVPDRMRAAELAYVAPVAGECGVDVIEALEAKHIVVGAQGWLRSFAEDGSVIPAIGAEIANPPAGLYAVVFSEFDHPDAEAIAHHFSDFAEIVALTRGDQGATLFVDGRVVDVAADHADEVDPTGAGDVFGLVLGIAMLRGVDLLDAARLASEAAARVIEGPGMGRLPEFYASPTWQRLLAA